MKRVKSEIKTSKISQIQSAFLYLTLHYDKPALESPPTNTSQYLYLHVFRSLCERCICNFFSRVYIIIVTLTEMCHAGYQTKKI